MQKFIFTALALLALPAFAADATEIVNPQITDAVEQTDEKDSAREQSERRETPLNLVRPE